MSKAIHRIITLIDHLGISARQFDISIGTANGYTLRMHKNSASVGSDIIERILEVYPQVNLMWLITGKGEMLVEEKPTINSSEAEIEAYINQRLNEKWSQEKRALMDEILKEIEDEKAKK